MFDLGKGDKEKLEENMEEIKQLVNEGQEEESTTSPELEEISKTVAGQKKEEDREGEDPEQDPVGEISDEPDMDKIEDQTPVDDMKDAEEDSSKQDFANPTDENQLDQEFDQMQEDIKDEINSLKQTQEHHERQRTHENTSGTQDAQQEGEELQEHVTHDNTGSTNKSEVTQTSELVEHEEEEPQEQQVVQPLFLEVDNFEDMKQMIEEMHYLTTEMDDVMQHLVAGLEEDQETMSEAEQILDEFQARREKVNETLKNN